MRVLVGAVVAVVVVVPAGVLCVGVFCVDTLAEWRGLVAMARVRELLSRPMRPELVVVVVVAARGGAFDCVVDDGPLPAGLRLPLPAARKRRVVAGRVSGPLSSSEVEGGRE